MKTFAIFVLDRPAVQHGELYRLNWNPKWPNWYTLGPDSSYGFSAEDVAKHSHGFVFGDTEAEVREAFRRWQHAQKHGKGESGDFQCPDCGYWYVDQSDDYDCNERIECVCGCTFLVSIKRVKVTYHTEKL